jgi:hypothetical protein
MGQLAHDFVCGGNQMFVLLDCCDGSLVYRERKTLLDGC